MSDNKCGLSPFGNRIVIQPIEEEETVGGIFLPSNDNNKMKKGKVVAVGPGNLSKENERIPLTIKVGATVMLNAYAGTEYQHDGRTYLVARDDDVMGEFLSS